jgi:hypothetical protein
MDKNEEWQRETTRLAPKKETVTGRREKLPADFIDDRRV